MDATTICRGARSQTAYRCDLRRRRAPAAEITTTTAIDASQSQMVVSIPMSERWNEPHTEVPPTVASAHQPPWMAGAKRIDTPAKPAMPSQMIEARDCLAPVMCSANQHHRNTSGFEINL